MASWVATSTSGTAPSPSVAGDTDPMVNVGLFDMQPPGNVIQNADSPTPRSGKVNAVMHYGVVGSSRWAVASVYGAVSAPE